MALISHSKATHGLGDAANCLHLIHISPLAKTEDVVTPLALTHLATMQQTHLGLGFTARRLLATTLTYASILSAPFIALLSSLWLFSHQIQQTDSWTWTLSGSTLATLVATDLALGKVLGIRPITAGLFAIYDMHRYGARTVAGKVEESYKNHEKEARTSYKESHDKLLNELKGTYLGVAEQIQHLSPAARKVLQNQLTTIRIGLKMTGLSAAEVIEILSPLESALQLAQHPISAKPDAEPSPFPLARLA